MSGEWGKEVHFLLCSYSRVKEIFFDLSRRGRGIHGEWPILAEKLRSLGVVPIAEKKKMVFSVEKGCNWKAVNGSESFVNAARKNMGLVGEAAWLQLGEGEVQSREEKLRKCLVGSFGKGPLSTSESFTLRKWATITWSLKQRLKVSVFKGFFLLFDFKDCMEAERVFARGSRRLKERILQPARWKPEIGCVVKKGSYKEAWVRVLGLPLHLWSREFIKKIGDCCRKFVPVDEDLTDLNQLRWARILVKLDGRALPASLQVVIGSPSFSIQLWCEIPPKFSKVILRSCNSGSQDLEIWGDKAGGSCTGKGVRKEMHPLQIDGVDVLTLSGRRVYFGESAAFCISKATAGGKGNGGCGRVTSEGGRDGLEENVVRSFWRGGQWISVGKLIDILKGP